MSDPHPVDHAGWWLAGAHLALVKSIQDPETKGRVQVQLRAADPEATALVWARVAVPFAGTNYGAFLIPDVGEEVLVVFTGNDARYPVVIGALWNGAHSVPESCPGDVIDRWTFTGKAGTHIAIIEESTGTEKVEIETPAGVKATLTDEAGGSIELKAGTNTLTMDSSGISLVTQSTFAVQASTVTVNGSSVSVTSGSSDFSGAVSAGASVSTPSVVGGTYTPGGGNIW